MVNGAIPSVNTGDLIDAIQVILKLEDLLMKARDPGCRPPEFLKMIIRLDRDGDMLPPEARTQGLPDDVEPFMLEAISMFMASRLYIKDLVLKGRTGDLERAELYQMDLDAMPPMPKLPSFYVGTLQECIRFRLGRDRRLPHDMEAIQEPGLEHRIMEWLSFVPDGYPYQHGSRPGQVDVLQNRSNTPWAQISVADCIKMSMLSVKLYTIKRLGPRGADDMRVMDVVQRCSIPIFALSATTGMIGEIVKGLMGGEAPLELGPDGEYEATGEGHFLTSELLF